MAAGHSKDSSGASETTGLPAATADSGGRKRWTRPLRKEECRAGLSGGPKVEADSRTNRAVGAVHGAGARSDLGESAFEGNEKAVPQTGRREPRRQGRVTRK